MTQAHPTNQTVKQRVLNILLESRGTWIPQTFFVSNFILCAGQRISELKLKEGWDIESRRVKGCPFNEYKIN